jgi:hypothetical protein
MKKILFLTIMSLSLALYACGGHSHDHDGHQHENPPASTDVKSHGEGKEYTSKYVCPMHCAGSGSEQPGQCPSCKMDYVLLSEHVHDGHNH